MNTSAFHPAVESDPTITASREHAMRRFNTPKFSKQLIALAAGAALSPGAVWALDLVQSPPLPIEKASFVAPNVIISIDDSGSMNFRLTDSNGGTNSTAEGYGYPYANGTWNNNARRINILKYALKEVFSDTDLIPTNKIRLAWQAMHNNGGSSNAKNVDSANLNQNSMRPIDATVGASTHRANFLAFVSNLSANSGTPSHLMFKQADDYMRRGLSSKGPWSSDPGGTGSKATEYLGCRRNYHIMMTDGRWNGAVSGGEKDNTPITLPDGTAYSLSSDQTNVYRSNTADTLADWAFYSWSKQLQDPTNLKDADKLKPSKAYEDAPATEAFTASRIVKKKTETKTVDLEKYWNPKYDPATWPHMVTYTIGFSNEAVTWPGAPEITPPTQFVPASFDGAFPELVVGYKTWPDMSSESKRSADLWHAAINGRGRFYAVTKAEDLGKAFTEIIGKINEDSATLPDKIQSGGGTSAFSMSNKNTGNFATVYEAKKGWKGYVTATDGREPEPYACKDENGNDDTCYRFASAVAGWQDGGVPKNTADRLDSMDPSARLILSWNDESKKAASFKWASDETYLSTAQKASLGLDNAAPGATTKNKGENVLNFIRGARNLEADPATAAKPFRKRESIQGDIVNSTLWYTGAPAGVSTLAGYSTFAEAQKNRLPMLYVGGNDGMLHGFSAKDGTEKIAYVPRGVIAGLKQLAEPEYEHRYYVDGSPMTGDIKDGSNWKTMLVGTLGAGGKGYFMMDVTDPTQFLETNAASLVPVDRTRGNAESAPDCSSLTGTEKAACQTVVKEDRDIGNITAQPSRKTDSPQETTQIALMNNGRWAAVMGNGYNSANQRPVLLVQYLDSDRGLVRVQTTAAATGVGNAKDNGLAAPTLVDLNGDGTVDIVYAGDNLGNLWKFDLTSDDAGNWKAALGTDVPLFTAKGPASMSATTRDKVQPITAPPIVRANDRMKEISPGATKTEAVGGMMVAFGTGRNLTEDDRKTDVAQPIQTLYSVLDNARYRKKSGSNLLEICADGAEECGPGPSAVGTMTATGPLAKQSISTVSGDLATVTATQALDKTGWASYKGWYLDLPGDGERMIQPMQFFDGSNILAAYTESPSGTKNASSTNSEESCVAQTVGTIPGTQWRTLINIMDGKRPTIQLVDANGDGIYKGGIDSDADKNVNRREVPLGTPTLITKGERIIDATGGGKEELARMPEQSTRPSWRQLN